MCSPWDFIQLERSSISTLPILGPSNLRDGVGSLADGFLDSWNYLGTSIPVNLGIKAYDTVNRTSLTIGEYEDLKVVHY